MSPALKQTMSADEFLRWAEGKDGRWELHDGIPAMMSPERVLHGDAKGEAYAALREAVRRSGLPCKAYPRRRRSADRREDRLPARRVGFLRRQSADA